SADALRYISTSFFSCSDHPRDLLSFPTRRSSDLVRVRRTTRIELALAGAGSLAGTIDPLRATQSPGISPAFDRQTRQPRSHYFRSEEHTSELQSRGQLVCRLLLEKKKRRSDRRAP